MKIFVCTTKHNYDKLSPIISDLEEAGHIVTLPNSYDNPMMEEKVKKDNPSNHSKWKGNMLRLQIEKIVNNDAILVANFDKNGVKNYIGGATFLELFKAWELGRKIFLLNPPPDSNLRDEILAFNPIIINGDFSLIK